MIKTEEEAVKQFREDFCLPCQTLGGKFIGYKIYEQDVDEVEEMEAFISKVYQDGYQNGREEGIKGVLMAIEVDGVKIVTKRLKAKYNLSNSQTTS